MILIPKDTKLEPGTWAPETFEGFATATMKCPNGHIGSLSGHTIKADGTVFPSVDCMNGNCDFHDWVKLEGWGT